MRQVHCFDWDGTLVHHERDNFTFINVTPIREAIAEVQQLIKEGHEVHIVTARCTPSLQAVTHEQVLRYLGSDFPTQRIHMQPREQWVSDDVDAEYKAAKLIQLKATHYTGDRVSDLRAAEMAKVPFTFVGVLQ